MRYRLSTLVILTAVGPPAIAVLWHAWGFILLLSLVAGLLAAWYLVSWLMARLVAEFVASLMG